MPDNPYGIQVYRPNPWAKWSFDAYDGPAGSAMHHYYLTVAASYQASRPDVNGLPNRIEITRKQDRGEKSILLDRTAASALVDMLTDALAWGHDHEGAETDGD